MKKLAIIAIVPLMFVTLSGCTKTEQKPAQETTVQGEETFDLLQPQETATEEEATEEDSEEASKDTSLELLNEAQIFSEVVENSEDITLDRCASFKDERLRAQCEAKVYSNQALADLDESVCDSITLEREKNDCKTNVQNEIVTQDFLDSMNHQDQDM